MAFKDEREKDGHVGQDLAKRRNEGWGGRILNVSKNSAT